MIKAQRRSAPGHNGWVIRRRLESVARVVKQHAQRPHAGIA